MLQNKHIIRASFICLFLAILGSIMFYRYFTLKNIVLETIIKENEKISSYFTSNIYDKFPDLQILSTGNEPHEFLENASFVKFASDSVDFFALQNKIKISIITNKNLEIVASSDVAVNYNPPPPITGFIEAMGDYFLGVTNNKELTKALSKKNVVNNIMLKKILHMNDKIAFIESYYPLTQIGNNGPEHIATLKIISDISEEWKKIRFFEKRVSIFLLSVFATFFGVIIFNTHHAQRIIDKQVETHKFLEEARIKAELESSAKTQFLANVSHELRTPLHAIIGFSEVIITEAYGKLQPTQYLEYIHDINNSGKHLLTIINDILDFSSASADKLKVDLIELDLIKLASSSARFVKPSADAAGVNIIEKFPKDRLVIKADPKRLKQALLNLLSNAVKFTPEKGNVTLAIENSIQEGKVKIKVIDTGIGMEERDIPKALSTFGQVDNKLSRKYEGTGLGLPLTKKLVELMGGEFEISSKPGRGTNVTLTFKQEGI